VVLYLRNYIQLQKYFHSKFEGIEKRVPICNIKIIKLRKISLFTYKQQYIHVFLVKIKIAVSLKRLYRRRTLFGFQKENELFEMVFNRST